MPKVEDAQLAVVMDQATEMKGLHDVVYSSAKSAVNVVEQPSFAKSLDVTNSLMFEGEEK